MHSSSPTPLRATTLKSYFLPLVSLLGLVTSATGANLVWTNTAGGNWNVAANWSPNQVPGAADTVFITNNGTYTVTLNADNTNASLTLGGASGTQTLTNNSGFDLTLNGASSVGANGRLGWRIGTLTGPGDLTVAGSLHWNGGTHSGVGLTTIAPGGTLLMGTGTTKDLSARPLRNAGTITYSGGTFRLGGGAMVTNAASGQFDVAADASFATLSGGGLMVNEGLWRKTAGAGNVSLTFGLNNAGTVQVLSGTLILNGNSTNSGAYEISANATVDFSATTLALLAGSSVTGAGSLRCSGGSTACAGYVNVAGTNEFTAGTFTFSGTNVLTGALVIAGGTANFNGAGTITPSSLELSSGTLGGTNPVTVNGPFTWSAGSLSGTNTVVVNAGLTVTGAASKDISGRTLVNLSTATWSAGVLRLGSGAVFSNSAAGLFDVTFDGNLSTLAGGGLLANNGTLRKSAGAGAAIVLPTFHNTGTVEIQSGTLTLNGSGTNNGLFTITAGATLDVSPSGTVLLGGSSSITGDGNFKVSGGTVNLTGNIAVAGTNSFSAGTANFSGSYVVSNSVMVINGGIANFNGDGVISPASFQLASGTLGGSNAVTVDGPFVWTSGTISGTSSLAATAGISLSGASTKDLSGRTLINLGTATWSAGVLRLGSGAVLSNSAAGLINLTFDGNLSTLAGGGLFANNGTFRKSSGPGAAVVLPTFNNAGIVEIQSGTLTLNGGGTNSGVFDVSAGATLDISPSATLLMGGTSTVTGAGNFKISGGTVGLTGYIAVAGTNTFSAGTANFSGAYIVSNGVMIINGGIANFNGDGAIAPASLQLDGGTLGGSNDVTVNGPFVWSSGTISGTNRVIANGGLTLDGPSTKDLAGRTLVNAAASAWNAGVFRLAGGAMFSNAPAGTFDVTFDGNLSTGVGGGSVANAGLFRQTAGTIGTSITAIPFQNSGAVEILGGRLSFAGAAGIYAQTAGTTLLNGGDLESTAAIRILGGTLAGNGLVNAALTNSGTIAPGTSPGQLIITGPYTQTTNGTLAIELAGAPTTTNYDRLVFSNGFTLAGALTVTLTNDFYPAPDVIFTNLIRGGNRTNTFSTFNFPPNVLGLQINYGPTNVDLEVINTLPSLPPVSAQIVNELVLLSLNANASDADAPAQTLSYSLLSSPANASISSLGQITWTPTEAEGPMTTNITVVVTDNGTPNLTTNVTFSVTVNEINVAPNLTVPPTQTITEENPLTGVSASAADSDLPANPLTFSLVAPPAGMAIHPASGAISWTPTEAHGSNLFTITVVVTDTNAFAVNTPSFSVTNTFNILVNESNRPPVLTPPANQTITEENALTGVSASATDPDVPGNALTFSLISPPAGMTINSGSGLISWTPGETQGSNTFTITIAVSDTNPPAINARSFTATNTFTVTVNESNRPPVLTPPANQTLTEQTPLVGVSASATDPDSPANALTYSLVAPPAGMTINSGSGLISWTPDESQGSNSYTIAIVVTDTNPPAINTRSFNVTNTFAITVNESNRPPVLTLPPSVTISELVPYANSATATDPDLPANALTFALVSGPTGMVVNASGGISWTPSEFQGPGPQVVQIKVSDANPPAVNATSLSVTGSFTLTVSEVNLAPVVGALAPQSGNPGQTLSFSATATDADLPVNALSFSLVNPPAGAGIVSGNGLFTWRLPAGLANTTNTLAVRVTDNGSPNLSGTNTFVVTVNPIVPVVLTPLGLADGQFRLSVTGSLGPDYVLQGSTTLTSFTDLDTNTPAAMPFNFTNTTTGSNRSYRVRLSP